MAPWTCLLIVAAVGQAGPARGLAFFEPVQPPRSVQVMAHRGAMARAPENTAAALEASIADGVEWVEVDVRLTRDGHHVLFHDDRIDGKTDRTGLVRALTLAELTAADAGSKFARRFARQRILTLEQGLELARNRVNLYLDCKDVNPALLARTIAQAQMGRQVVVYGAPELLQAVRRAAGAENPVGLMTKWRPQFGIDRWVDELRPDAVEIDAADVTAETCRVFHQRAIKVQAKVLGNDDRPEVWDRMAAAGVDWFQTDRAEEVMARQVLRKVPATRVKISQHRGASHYAPENTLESLRKAVALGADYVEFDIQTTRDGAFVLLHDRTLDRTTTGHGAVRDHNAAEIAALDAGTWFGRPFAGAKVPTLDAFLEAAAPTGISLYVDAKNITPEALAAALARHGLIGRSVVYQSAAFLEKLRAIAPELRRMPPLHDPAQVEELAARVKPYAFDTSWTILSRSLIDRCHALGIHVFSDALGDHETIDDYRRTMRDGIDLIQTDHPLRVLRAIELEAASPGHRS